MNFPFKWVRDPKWQKESAQVFVLEMNPHRISPAVSVQAEWQGCKGIIRGIKDQTGNLLEDFITEKVISGRLVNADQHLSGADEMRKDIWTIDQHKSVFCKEHPGQKIVGWVGNGNLLSNPHFVSYVDGSIFHLEPESEHLENRIYTSLVVRRPGFKRVSIETIKYHIQNGKITILSESNNDITEQIQYATFGQQLVRNSCPLNRDRIVQMAIEQQFYDLRHLFLFACIPTGEKQWLDVGLGAFWDNGKLNTQSIKSALKSEPIKIDVRQFPDDIIRKALYAKGYNESDNPQKPGEFFIRFGELSIVLLDGIYPHNMIGIKADGSIISVVLKGLSNRVGVTIQGAAEIMADFGAVDALLIDNGGDVMMSVGDRQVLGSSESSRNRLRSILFFLTEDISDSINLNDYRLVEYLPQTYEMLQDKIEH